MVREQMLLLQSLTEKVHVFFRSVSRDDLELGLHTALIQNIQQLAEVLSESAESIIHRHCYSRRKRHVTALWHHCGEGCFVQIIACDTGAKRNCVLPRCYRSHFASIPLASTGHSFHVTRLGRSDSLTMSPEVCCTKSQAVCRSLGPASLHPPSVLSHELICGTARPPKVS